VKLRGEEIVVTDWDELALLRGKVVRVEDVPDRRGKREGRFNVHFLPRSEAQGELDLLLPQILEVSEERSIIATKQDWILYGGIAEAAAEAEEVAEAAAEEEAEEEAAAEAAAEEELTPFNLIEDATAKLAAAVEELDAAENSGTDKEIEEANKKMTRLFETLTREKNARSLTDCINTCEEPGRRGDLVECIRSCKSKYEPDALVDKTSIAELIDRRERLGSQIKDRRGAVTATAYELQRLMIELQEMGWEAALLRDAALEENAAKDALEDAIDDDDLPRLNEALDDVEMLGLSMQMRKGTAAEDAAAADAAAAVEAADAAIPSSVNPGYRSIRDATLDRRKTLAAAEARVSVRVPVHTSLFAEGTARKQELEKIQEWTVVDGADVEGAGRRGTRRRARKHKSRKHKLSKRNRSKRNRIKSNRSKRNRSKRNRSKRNRIKSNRRKRNRSKRNRSKRNRSKRNRSKHTLVPNLYFY
jgi:hypothetical protein